MAPKQHWLDTLGEELSDYVETMVDAVVEGLTEGGVVPFAANVSNDQRLAYYTAQFFNPDGTPNAQGRAQEMDRLGEVGWAEAMRSVLKAHPELHAATGAPPPAEPLQEGVPQ